MPPSLRTAMAACFGRPTAASWNGDSGLLKKATIKIAGGMHADAAKLSYDKYGEAIWPTRAPIAVATPPKDTAKPRYLLTCCGHNNEMYHFPMITRAFLSVRYHQRKDPSGMFRVL